MKLSYIFLNQIFSKTRFNIFSHLHNRFMNFINNTVMIDQIAIEHSYISYHAFVYMK